MDVFHSESGFVTLEGDAIHWDRDDSTGSEGELERATDPGTNGLICAHAAAADYRASDWWDQ